MCSSIAPGFPRRGPGFQRKMLMRVCSSTRFGTLLSEQHSGWGKMFSFVGLAEDGVRRVDAAPLQFGTTRSPVVAGKKLFAFLDDLYVVCQPPRVRDVPQLMGTPVVGSNPISTCTTARPDQKPVKNLPCGMPCASSKHCGSPDLPKRAVGCCLTVLDPLAKWNRRTSTNLRHGRQQILTWRSGALNGAGSSPVLTHNATATTMHSARPGPWGCALTGCVARPPLPADVRPRSPRECPTPSCLVRWENLRPPPHLGSWIDRLCNPFQDADRGSPARFQILVFLT